MSLFGEPTPRRGRTASGVWRGVVTRVAGGRPFVEVARFAAGREFGPLEVLQGPWTVGLRTEAEAGGAGESAFASHTHGAGLDLAAGDRVLVAFVEGNPDSPVVLGRLA